ncbi:hypothetical protein AMECASPLE_006166 [Ameca splendens]|uniref:Uncharacterized protein n=1 Tax=Ameca splendens TaxID=208324 RepID=A0ABV0XCE5_9TELE
MEGGVANLTPCGPKATGPPPQHHALFTLYLASTDTSFRKEPGMGGSCGDDSTIMAATNTSHAFSPATQEGLRTMRSCCSTALASVHALVSPSELPAAPLPVNMQMKIPIG